MTQGTALDERGRQQRREILRALEQSWGRNPDTMIPDVRYTPNPNDAPGGPLVERGE